MTAPSRLTDAEREQRRAAGKAAAVKARRQRLLALATPAPIEPGWRDRAACLEAGPYAFADPDHTDAVKAMCSSCPVARSCLEAAMQEEHRQPMAYRAYMRGGLTTAERTSLDRIRRHRKDDAA